MSGPEMRGIIRGIKSLLEDCAVKVVANEKQTLLRRAKKVYLSAVNPEAYAACAKQLAEEDAAIKAAKAAAREEEE